jgi:hypothetical protein
MQAKPKLFYVFLVALVASLILGACTGGGSTGSTWFNTPSIKVRVQDNGTAKVYGLPVNSVVLPPELVQQLQTAGVEKLDVRAGYNGVHVYANGEDLPYLAWNEDAVKTLQEVVKTQPIPNANMIANALPWLRKVGLGVALFIPSANGKPADIPNWKGETEITPETPENVIGPMTIGGLAFDDQGDASIQGVPVSELEKALGTSLGISMDPNTIAMIKSLGADTIDIKLTPNGVALMLGDKPLPGIAYDSATLEQAVTLADAFVDEQTAETLNKVTEILPNADVETVISLTGEPAVETELAKIPVVINDDGTLSVFGLPAGADTVIDPETLTKLQDANIQHLDLNIDEDGIAVATNGQKLPTIGWNDESLQTLADIIGPMAGMSPDLIETVLGMVRNTGIQASVALPVAAGERAIDIPAQVDMTMTPSDLGDMVPPTIHAVAKFDKNGELLEFGGLSAESLAALGVSGISLPPDTMATLNDLGAQNIEIKSEPNKLILYLDGAEALTINNDTESLANALDLAAPFLGEDSPLSDPALSQLLREQILPLIPAMDLDVTVEIE